MNKHGPPLLWRTDAAQELVGKIMTAFWRSYGTTASHTKSYHPEGNSMAERVMLFLNKCLRQLTDEQYKRWPKYLSSFEAAWNTHFVDSIGCTPFEAAHGVPMLSPLAAGLMTLEGNGPPVAACAAVAATRLSAASWVKYAHANALWHKRRTEQRMNASGYARDFVVGDLVCVYVPPSAAEAQKRRRKAKHMSFYRGPCKVTKVDGSCYTVQLVAAPFTVYDHTLQNIAPWNGSGAAPAAGDDGEGPVGSAASAGSASATPSHSTSAAKEMTYVAPPADSSVFDVDDLLVAKDHPTLAVWWMHRVIAVTDDYIETRIFGTWTPQVRTAKFEPLWIDKQDRITTKAHGGSQWSPWTQRILTYTLPQLVLARYFKLKKDGKLTAESVRFMMALPGIDCHVALSNKQAVLDALVGI